MHIKERVCASICPINRSVLPARKSISAGMMLGPRKITTKFRPALLLSRTCNFQERYSVSLEVSTATIVAKVSTSEIGFPQLERERASDPKSISSLRMVLMLIKK
eukprot:TRINITY_DN3420_c0_g1_i2.p1 TRINITY_DN3420_c0_g1~~TRINITY_DN3420_c0_g1_i2.p1  ORF type:complete len:105 (-),score=1.48 TRINITY_DN3420_c0_g1_i2:73-387(-)